jgi:twitching motility protein PilI
LLFPLQQAGEIFSLVPLQPVPHTRNWFAGVANLRGGLHGVVDLGAFLGMSGRSTAAAEGTRDQARLIALNPSIGLNCALLVDRLAGLRSAEQLATEEADAGPKPAFAGARLRDREGRSWQEILLSSLAEDEQFLGIVG